ncbi:MAG: DUF1887 family protein [Burkholderiaceae bacterium]|nr:DUF1887 family protein [Burkholderiaceae bacterium]
MSGRHAFQLCIATGQNLANLIPALQCAAEEVWILETPAMRASASHLADALRARGIRVQRRGFDDDDIGGTRASCEAIATELDGRPVTINITGGTKLMTLALTETLAGYLATDVGTARPELVYTDTLHGRLDWLGATVRSERLQDVLRINDVLLAQGYRRQAGSGGSEAAYWQQRATGRATLTRRLGDSARELGGFFGLLAKLASDALQGGEDAWRPHQKLQYCPGGKYAQVLRAAVEKGLVVWDADVALSFVDRDSAEYFSGGWVEEYAGLKVSGARPTEWAPRLEIEHVESRTSNELDAMVVHRNRVLVIECKAARAAGVGRVADWIYKVSQLARSVGGGMARPLLLSAREVDAAHRQRAAEYGVDVLACEELCQLPGYLRSWMAG